MKKLNERRREKIRDDHDKGMNIHALMKKYHHCFTTIKDIVSEGERESARANKALAKANQPEPLENLLRQVIERGRKEQPQVAIALIDFRTGDVELAEMTKRKIHPGNRQ